MSDLATVSVGALLAITLVAVAALAFQMIMLMRAARKPYFEEPRAEKMQYGVRGGRFQAAGGRGATVHWGAPVLPDEPASEAVPASETAPASETGQPDEQARVPSPRLDRPAVPGARTAGDTAQAPERTQRNLA